MSHDAGPLFEQIHPEDRPRLLADTQPSDDDGQVRVTQYRMIQADGTPRWLETRAVPRRLADGSTLWHGYVADIDESKRTVMALQHSEERLRGLFELSPFGVALVDSDSGRLLAVNHALTAQSGFSDKALRRMTLCDLTAGRRGKPADPADHLPLDQDRFGPIEQTHCRRDGSRFPVEVSGIRVHDQTDQALSWCIIVDISERKRVERLKNEFVSTVSHELRTPLTSISGSLRLLDQGVAGDLPEQAASLVYIAGRNAQRLIWLVNDLLDMDKLLSGEMAFRFETLPARPLLERSLDANRGYAATFNVELRLDAEPELPSIHIDARRLEQVLANLLSNAIKFSDTGGVVELSARVTGDVLRIRVTDNGPGISEEFMPRLFQRFAQADSSDTRQKDGTGLGLAISQALAEQMDGRIRCQSQPGVVTHFDVELPLASALKPGHGT